MIVKKDMTLEELFKLYPKISSFFLKRKMLCVGCPMQPYHTVQDVAEIYKVGLSEMIEEIEEEIGLGFKVPKNKKNKEEV